MYSPTIGWTKEDGELFLLAGRRGLGGVLPPVEVTAWSLRTMPDEIEETLETLEGLKIVNRLADGNWNVTHCAARQRRHRELQHSLSHVLMEEEEELEKKLRGDSDSDSESDSHTERKKRESVYYFLNSLFFS